uniref:26S proteasome non-ATPase regulatory subunit 2 homolog n=1 Tax=Brassica oleracea var. oleracea TaxID=109376 RepID=A0A0D3A3S5_BRAOL
MRQEIRASTSSMTSVPKPLKFLRPHYGTLKELHKNMADSDLKKLLADILSVLALTMSAEGERESLGYRLTGSGGDIGSWGHEYVRNLAGEIAEEYTMRQSEEASIEDLMDLVKQIVAFHMKHNAETEAVDLLMDVEELDLLLAHVDRTNFRRTCNYLTSSAKFLPGPDDMLVLDIAYMIYMKFEEYPNALQVALFLDNMQVWALIFLQNLISSLCTIGAAVKSFPLRNYVKQVFTSCTDLLRKKQFCYMISRHGITVELDSEMVADKDDRDMLQDIVNNTKLSEGYLTLARDIEVMEAKTPEDIYKAHLLDGRASSGPSVDSARQNLAATFVNAFVNAGFGQDKLMTVPSDAASGTAGNWLFKNKEHGKTSAAASLGMILLWDVDAGLTQLDKYFHSTDNPVLAGALLGVGINNCGIKSDCDPALALLGEYVDNEDSSVRIGAIMGLGIAYAGSQNDQLRSSLSPILNDAKAPLDVIAFAALSLGMIYVGSCNEEVAQSIIFALMDRSEAQLGDALTRFLPLGLGLLYLGKQESVEATAEVSKTFNEKIRKYCDMTLLSCAYAGTGNVLKVQDLLAQCGEHLEKGDIHQGPAVLGIAMVAMSEELGLDMAIRSLERVLQYGEQNIRRAVPLALGLLCISNPKVNVMDTLSRLSHDTDSEVAMVRIAQGFVHMGKGLLTLSPFHSERLLLSPTALAGIVTLLHACLDMKSIILGKYHYVLYFIVLAMQPRMMLTVDENLKTISVPVRVGQAVDVVGQAGRPKTITGFQTHSTPVLLAAGERAELATDKYIPLSPILEGFIILKENPDYREE